jgi:hypothetical protein
VDARHKAGHDEFISNGLILLAAILKSDPEERCEATRLEG